MSALKVETDIITSIAASLVGCDTCENAQNVCQDHKIGCYR